MASSSNSNGRRVSGWNLITREVARILKQMDVPATAWFKVAGLYWRAEIKDNAALKAEWNAYAAGQGRRPDLSLDQEYWQELVDLCARS